MPIRKRTVAEAKAVIHDPELCHSAEKVIAAHTLMEACEHDLEVTIDDMLRCLDYGGTIATVGARCLYVRTGRDGLGWTTASGWPLPYVVDRADWEKYLREHHSHNAA
jgi:hypothetical protein